MTALPSAPVPTGGGAGSLTLPYHALQRAGRPGRWRPLVGVLVVAVGVFLVGPVLVQALFAAGLALAGEPVVAGLRRLIDLANPTPLGLAYLNLALAVAIPVTWGATRWLHGLPPRWLTSVRPRMHWGFFAACLLLSAVALVTTLLVSLLIPASAVPDATVGLNDFTTTTRDFVLVIVLLTPLQAAGEEYVFRGYLTQAFGGLFGRTAAVVVPAVLFALAHGLGQSLPVFFDRLAFGLVAGVLVVRTGGLEASIAMHVLNNFVAYGLGLAFGDMASTLNPTGGTWWSLPATLTQSLVYLGLALVVARLTGVASSADPAVLAASRRRVYGVPSAPQGA